MGSRASPPHTHTREDGLDLQAHLPAAQTQRENLEEAHTSSTKRTSELSPAPSRRHCAPRQDVTRGRISSASL